MKLAPVHKQSAKASMLASYLHGGGQNSSAGNNLHLLCKYALEIEATSIQTDQRNKQQMQDAFEQRKMKNRMAAEKHRQKIRDQKARDQAAQKDKRIKALEHDVYLLEHAIGMMYAINGNMKRAKHENSALVQDKMHIDFITHRECCQMGWLFHIDQTQTEVNVFTYDIELAVRAASETMSFQKRRRLMKNFPCITDSS